MTKEKLIARIVDTFDDFSGENPQDYLYMDPLTLEEATMYLSEARANERAADLEPDECLPAETTPELYMEAENCYIRMMQYKAHLENLADFLTEHEYVAEYDMYRDEYQHSDPEVIPVDFIVNGDTFPFAEVDHVELLQIGMNSGASFNFNNEYCWFDKDKMQLFSTNTPYKDGIIHADKFSEFILSPAGQNCLDYLLDHVLDDEDIRSIFGYDESSVRSRYISC